MKSTRRLLLLLELAEWPGEPQPCSQILMYERGGGECEEVGC